jgi:hypothetical protein
MRRLSYRRAIASWLPVAAAASVLAFTVYAAVQQARRSGANDPQLEIAHAAVSALDGGAAPTAVVTHPTVDIATSEAPWMVVYGSDGSILASSGTFEEHPPEVPDDVIGEARADERVFSWQPRDGLRFATVASPYHEGVVVVARSMAEVERRESQTLAIVAIGWALALAAAALGALGGVWLRDRGEQPH